MNEVKDKLDTSRFADVIDDAMKPDTILNIQKKYDLSLPFVVKLVKPLYWDNGTMSEKPGLIINVDNLFKCDEGFISVKRKGIANTNACSSKKFILWQ